MSNDKNDILTTVQILKSVRQLLKRLAAKWNTTQKDALAQIIEDAAKREKLN